MLRNYNDMFDIYFCSDHSEARRYFNLDMLPDVFPQLFIIDPKGKQELKKKLLDENTEGDEQKTGYTKKYWYPI